MPSPASPGVCYRLAPGLDIVPAGDGALLLSSDALSLRIGEPAAGLLRGGLLSYLAGGGTIDFLRTQLPTVDPEVIQGVVDTLVEKGAVVVLPEAADGEGESWPWVAALSGLGIGASEGEARMRTARVAVFGLEGHGAHLAALLARSGVGTIALFDPQPLRETHLPLLPQAAPDSIGRALEDVVRDTLAAGTTRVITGGELSRQRVHDAAEECDLLVGCVDRGFSAVHHWINEASLQRGVPAIYSEAAAHRWWVGPLVVPGETACYVCYRNRRLACAPHFDAALGREAYLLGKEDPSLHSRGVLPAAMPFLASLIALEIVKRFLGLRVPTLAGSVIEFDPFRLRSSTHPVLRRADCPACRAPQRREQPASDGLRIEGEPVDILALTPRLVSPRTGIVLSEPTQIVAPGEPASPFVFGVALADHVGPGATRYPGDTASGKGFTVAAARAGTLGEAVERYCGMVWHDTEVQLARFRDAGEALDPRHLVLYADYQYSAISFHAYEEESVLGWIPARSLRTGRAVCVPAAGVFMTYAPHLPERAICSVSSSGMAAGRSLSEAVVGAALEVVERDAFLLAWLLRLPCDAVDPATHPEVEVRELVAAYDERGINVHLFRLATDHCVPVFAAIATQREGFDGPFAAVGLGADLHTSAAARKAMLEMAQVRTGLAIEWRRPETRKRIDDLVADPSRVAGLYDHLHLFAGREARHALSFLLERPLRDLEWSDGKSSDPAARLGELAAELHAHGRDLLYVNLTPPEIGQLGLHAARVIIPDFQPLHFGYHEARLGGTRLHEIAARYGVSSAPDALNPVPHPLA